ncbi:MAG: hypothetical protein LIR50_07490 [Bacillota bacterium]|nr:hypothetical protein [Bacillota bacterium]
MAKRVTDEDIKLMNEAYLLCGTYSGVAKATGWSASTVKKYIIADYKKEAKTLEIEIIIPSVEETISSLKNHHELSCLSDEEKQDMKNLWKEVLV